MQTLVIFSKYYLNKLGSFSCWEYTNIWSMQNKQTELDCSKHIQTE